METGIQARKDEAASRTIADIRKDLKAVQVDCDFAYKRVRDAQEVLDNAASVYSHYVAKRDKLNQEINTLTRQRS